MMIDIDRFRKENSGWDMRCGLPHGEKGWSENYDIACEVEERLSATYPMNGEVHPGDLVEISDGYRVYKNALVCSVDRNGVCEVCEQWSAFTLGGSFGVSAGPSVIITPSGRVNAGLGVTGGGGSISGFSGASSARPLAYRNSGMLPRRAASFSGRMGICPTHTRIVKIKTFYNMVKSEIFASVLRDVCEVTEIPEDEIMSGSKSEEIVDARHLLVATLSRSGYYPGMIAERLHVTGRAVRKMLESFPSRTANSPGLSMCHRRVETMRNGKGTHADS